MREATILHRFGATVFHSSSMSGKRGKLDIFADRLRQASVEPTLLAFGQRICELMDVSLADLYPSAVTTFVGACGEPWSGAGLRWIREHHTLFSVLCASKFEDADAALEKVEIKPDADVSDTAVPRRPYQIGIRATCLTPLSHGGDSKSGNATLFRRMTVLGQKGTVLTLPYYAGNAIRGQVRDILADHLLSNLGIEPRRDRPKVALWFFHALYAGGALEEVSGATKKLAKELGDHGAVRSDGVREMRETLPSLSLLGSAMGNRVLSGHADFGDLRPCCREWSNGEASAAELFDWLYLTRREDHEEHVDHHGMIAVTECLKAGTVIEGGIDVRLHCSELSRSALGVGLRGLIDRGRIGAQARADLGSVAIEVDRLPDPEPYEAYLRGNKDAILAYLDKIGASHARD